MGMQVEAGGIGAKAASVTDPAKNVADFLGRVVAWPGEEPGYVNLHWSTPNLQYGFGGRPYRTLVDFMAGVERAKNRPASIKDIYFCLSRQKEHGKVDKYGRPYAKRSKVNAMAMKCVPIDVDVKPGPKGYPNVVEALNAIQKFVADASLPLPTALVHSGGGLHVYWISDRPLNIEEWAGYAAGLRALADQHGLHFDPAVTIDCARVLRVPDTFNLKEQIPRPVKLKYLAPTDLNFERDLAHIRSNTAGTSGHGVDRRIRDTTSSEWDSVRLPPRPQSPALFTAEYQAEIGTVYQAEVDPHIISVCPFFRDAFKTKGKDHDQGLWMQVGLATTFMRDGQRLFHELSKGYAGYTAVETDAMFERKLAEREEKSIGWPSCKAFEDYGSKQCAGCPHRGKIKSPLHLTVPAAPITPPAQANNGSAVSRSHNPTQVAIGSVAFRDSDRTRQTKAVAGQCRDCNRCARYRGQL